MNLRSFVVVGAGFAAVGAFTSYGASGCAPKTLVDDDAGSKTCMETGSGPGEGCACPPSYKPKACYEGPTGTLGPGRACKSGTRKCNSDGTLSACEGQVLPDPNGEVCNMIDDDCDGIVDNISSNEPIITDFTDAGLDPPIEAGAQCYVNGQQGLCAAGRYGCNMQGMKDCIALLKLDPDGGMSPYTEICNGLDDDCNGTVDDVDYNTQTCMVVYPDGGSPKGECANSVPSCVNGVETCPAKAPKPEVCNNKDDNCDGKIDNLACTMGGNTWCCNYNTTHICYSINLGNPYTCYQ